MNQKEFRARTEKTKAELRDLAETLALGGEKAGDAEILFIAATLLTAIEAAGNPTAMQDLNTAVMDFCIRQIKRDAGVSESQLAMDELFSTGKFNLN
jgi:hypothetical protein